MSCEHIRLSNCLLLLFSNWNLIILFFSDFSLHCFFILVISLRSQALLTYVVLENIFLLIPLSFLVLSVKLTVLVLQLLNYAT